MFKSVCTTKRAPAIPRLLKNIQSGWVKDTQDLFEIEDEQSRKSKEGRQLDRLLRGLEKALEGVEDPEYADYLILIWLRDIDDPEAEAKIKEYENKFKRMNNLITI